MCQSFDQTTVRLMQLLFAADVSANSYSLEMNIGRFEILSGLPPRRTRGSLGPAGLASLLCTITNRYAAVRGATMRLNSKSTSGYAKRRLMSVHRAQLPRRSKRPPSCACIYH